MDSSWNPRRLKWKVIPVVAASAFAGLVVNGLFKG